MAKEKVAFSLEQLQDAIFGNDHLGYCVECGEEHDACEPDARKYKCEYCGNRTVYGAEQIVIEFPELVE